MINVIYQGKVDIVDGTRIVCTTNKLSITSIVINNLDSNYTFTLNRFETGPGIHSVPMYRFELDAGDSIRDNEGYILSKGDYLELLSDAIDTTFYISGTQE
jgi:hypothetical protein